jgi:Undecaprenyl-phosphate galactose phosphotransferase WbaP
MEEPLITPTQVFIPTRRTSEWVRNRRTLMSFVLAAADFLGLFSAWALALFIRFTIFNQPIPAFYQSYALVLPIALLVYFGSGLYNHNISEVDELQRLFKSTTITYLIAATVLFLAKNGSIVSRATILEAWIYSLVLVPFIRELIRSVFVRMKIWGEPVVIFGNGRLGNEVADYLRANPRMGYNPVGVVDRRKVKRDDCSGDNVIHDANIFTNGEEIPAWMSGVHTAFVVLPETNNHVQEMLIRKQTVRFEQLIMVRSADRTGSLNVQPLDIGGIIGLKVGQNLLNRSQLLVKRVMDYSLIIIALPLLVPLFAIVALLIKLDSRGSVFYHQERIGYGGKTFKFWKFRSMYVGAEQKLIDYLAANPERKAEYEVNHKLKNDPRVTRVGRIIRKLSIDELPQLFNVIQGKMSLVGPRPFMGEEISFYDKCYSLYTYVLPGVTGLWQISGRSNVSYNTRVTMDDYYLRNWSIWLDIHILIRTITVVLRGRGSY